MAGALSSIAVYAARRSFQLQTPGGAAGTQSPAIPKGPFVLDQVAFRRQTPLNFMCLIRKVPANLLACEGRQRLH